MNKNGYVYIITNKNNTVLYTGVTSNLKIRIEQHKNKVLEGFSKEYQLGKLVYYESGDSIDGAIRRESQIKNWKRAWKIELIEKLNPLWIDLSKDL